MTNQKHTPGPWEIRDLSSDEIPNGDIAICGSGAEISIIKGSDAYHPGWNSEREANARLIAAAPELLTAAKHALPGCVGESEKLLRAAITKAEGGL